VSPNSKKRCIKALVKILKDRGKGVVTRHEFYSLQNVGVVALEVKGFFCKSTRLLLFPQNYKCVALGTSQVEFPLW